MTFDESQAIAAKEYLTQLMIDHKGNVVHAAREAGRCRSNFYRLLCLYEIKVEVRPPQAHRGNWSKLDG